MKEVNKSSGIVTPEDAPEAGVDAGHVGVDSLRSLLKATRGDGTGVPLRLQGLVEIRPPEATAAYGFNSGLPAADVAAPQSAQ